MSVTIINLIIQLIAGAIGGNAAGAISNFIRIGRVLHGVSREMVWCETL